MTLATLHEPAQDRPAMADRTTTILFDLMRKRGRKIVFTCALLTALVGAWLALMVEFDEENPYPVASSVILAWIGAAFLARLWILWIPRGAALLRSGAWRPVGARVVRAGRPSLTSLVECDGDTVLRVSRLSAAHHALIARTGRVWVVGPDEHGWASVRVDGSHVVFPARRDTAPRAEAGDVAGDVTALVAARMRVNSSVHLRWLPVMGAWAVAMAALGVPLMSLVGGLSVSVWLMVSRARVALVDRRLPALVADADWCELPVAMNPWFWREDGTSTAEGMVGLPDGRTLAVRMPNATVDLLGTIYERGTVWFSAVPESGKTVAVGFPGYPLLAVADIR